MYVSDIYAEGKCCNFSLVTKECENRSKYPPFYISAILKFDFQKRKQLHFSEANYLRELSISTEKGAMKKLEVIELFHEK